MTDAAPDTPDAERPSKTRRKQAMHALQSLGEALAALPAPKLAAIEMPDALREAIAEWRRTRSHEGRRRQMQYVGKLMRNVDAEPLREALARAQLGGARDTLALHRAERWREALVAGDEAVTRFLDEHPGADATALRRLVRAARVDPAERGERHLRAYRELFQFIKEASADE